MSKFKVGDWVIGNKKVNRYGITATGVKGVITNIFGTNIKVSGFWFEDECFDLIPNSELHITTDGKTTHAVLKENGKVTKRAKADCSPDDTFDFKIGAELAFKRLFGEDKPNAIREVKRHAKVGEWIKLTCSGGYSFAKKGDIVCVDFDIHDDCVGVKGEQFNHAESTLSTGWGFVNSSYIVLENYQPPKQIPAEFWERFKTEKIAVNCQTIQETQDFLKNSHKQGFNKGQTDYISHFADKKSNLCYRNYGYDDIEFYEKLGYTVITYTDLINGKLPEKKEGFKPYLTYDFNNKKIAPLGSVTNLKDLAHITLYTGDTVDLYNGMGYLGERVVCGDDFVMSVADMPFPIGRNGVFTIIKKRSYTEIADGEIVGSVKYIKSEGKNEK